jgi:hypothetical protein
MNRIVLALLAVFCALPSVFAREPDLDSAEAWAGTWKNDHGQTMTISFKGLNCVISYSKGTPDTGKMRGDGDTIEFEGSTKGGYEHSQGTLVLSADHNSITKNQTIFAQDGPEKHLHATYVRTGPKFPSTSEAETSLPFAGRWQSESNPGDILTIKVHGQNVTMTSSLGGEPPRSGTIRDGRIECRLSSHQQEIIELVNGRLIARGIFDGHEETDSYKRIR